MSLLNSPSPITLFKDAGTSFLNNPGASNAMAFDDARVALRRYVSLQLEDVSLSAQLFDLGYLIRDRKMEEIATQFSQIIDRVN
jgi:hypothetical protein